MHSETGIHIAARADLVYALAHDVECWADLLPHYVRSRAVERRPDDSLITEFVARRVIVPVLGLGLTVAWRSQTWSDPTTRRLRFVHTAGATRGMDVTWRIESAGTDACRVTIEHDFAPRLPFAAALVDRWFTQPIAGRTLATFKAIAEVVQAMPQSEPPPVAYT